MKTNGSFYAKRRPNSCSVLFLKDIIVLFKHSFMHQIFIEPVPYGKISANRYIAEQKRHGLGFKL